MTSNSTIDKKDIGQAGPRQRNIPSFSRIIYSLPTTKVNFLYLNTLNFTIEAIAIICDITRLQSQKPIQNYLIGFGRSGPLRDFSKQFHLLKLP